MSATLKRIVIPLFVTVLLAALDPSPADYSFNFMAGTLAVIGARPVIILLTGAGTISVVLTWSAIRNLTYRVQGRPGVSSGNWLDLSPGVTATNCTGSAVDSVGYAKHRSCRILISLRQTMTRILMIFGNPSDLTRNVSSEIKNEYGSGEVGPSSCVFFCFGNFQSRNANQS